MSDGGVVVKRILQPIGYFVAAAPFAVVEGRPRHLLKAIFTPPACLAIWLASKGAEIGDTCRYDMPHVMAYVVAYVVLVRVLMSAFGGCRHAAAHALVGSGP
jgi:hypothetical protein